MTVRASDGTGNTGDLGVIVTVNNEDDPGTLTLPGIPEVGKAVTASLSDPDGSVSGVTWVWESSTDNSTWTAISGAASSSYTPVTGDVGSYLRVTASYTDGEGSGKSAQASTANAVVLLLPPVKPTGVAAAAGHEQVTLSWDDPGEASITGYEYHQMAEPAKLIASDGVAQDYFGWAVSVDGNTMVVGANGDDDGSVSDSGSAYVFVRPSGEDWSEASQIAKLTASDGARNDNFGISVSVDGDTIVVGASRVDTGTGSAYVFVRPSKGWANATETAKLTASDRAEADLFGRSVSMDGDTIVVGASKVDTGTGLAYVFVKPSAGWSNTTETAKLTASDRAANDEFGISVSVDGNTIVVGAYQDDGPTNSGSAYVFIRPAGGWANAPETAKLTASDRSSNDEFGRSVSVDRDTIVVGAHRDDGPNNSGSAYVFVRPNAGWVSATETAKLTASDGAASDYFGRSVSVDGDTIVAGAHQTDGPSDSGSAYVFIRPAGGWANAPETAKLTASDGAEADLFGISVSVDGDTIVVGAYQDDDGSVSNSGSAYVFVTSGWAQVGGSGANTVEYTVTGLDNGIEHTFGIRVVNDGGPGPVSASVRATPSNSPASFARDAVERMVAENTASGQPIDAAVTATDADNDTLTYSLSGTDPGSFDLNASTGQLQTKAALDYETKSSYTVVVSVHDVKDADGNADTSIDDTITVTITVTNEEETGTLDLFDSRPQVGAELEMELSDPDGSVSGITWVWESSSDRSTWTVISGATSESYTPVTGDVGSYLRVTASYTDGEGSGKSAQGAYANSVISLTLAPLGSTNLIEGAGGTTFTVTGANVPDGLTYELEFDLVGGASVADFSVTDSEDNALTVLGSGVFARVDLDEGAVGSGSFTWQFQISAISDSISESGERLRLVFISNVGDGPNSETITIRLIDGNSLPAFGEGANATRSTAENSAAGTSVGSAVTATDAEGDTLVYSLSGTDAGSFDLNASTGQLQTKAALDYETKSSYEVVVSVHDGKDIAGNADSSIDDTITVTITVTNEDEVPGVSGSAGVTYEEDRTDAVGTYSATDPEGANISWDLSGDDEGLFTITAGELSFLAQPDYENPGDVGGDNAYEVTVEASDGTGNTGTLDVTITVRNVDEAGALVLSMESPVEGSAVTASLSDPDGSVTGVTWVWENSSDNSIWTPISGAPSSSYTPVTGDVGSYLRVTASYADGHGPNKSAQASTANAVVIPPELAKPTGVAATAGDEQVTLSWDDPGEASINRYEYRQVAEPAKLTASDGAGRDEFGRSVSVDGDTMVVGAPGDDDSVGSAYVFVRPSGGDWSEASQVAMLTASDGASGDRFGNSVSVDGDTIVVGAQQDEVDDTTSGSAYVFVRPSTGWENAIETAKLTPSDGAENDQFGSSVSVDGEDVVVGAYRNDGSGSAYVFVRPSGGDWANATETAKLTASDGASGDRFGNSVSVDGDTIVVGAYLHDGSGANSGLAYVFVRPPAGWTSATETGKLTASDGAEYDAFGISVSVDGDTVVVGASKDDDRADNSGSVYIFEKSATGWSNVTETAKLTASDGAASDEFGYSVSVAGDTIVVGAYRDDHRRVGQDDDGYTTISTDVDSGSAYVFVRPATGWSSATETAKLTASDGAARDYFGYAVSVDGDAIVVGAY